MCRRWIVKAHVPAQSQHQRKRTATSKWTTRAWDWIRLMRPAQKCHHSKLLFHNKHRIRIKSSDRGTAKIFRHATMHCRTSLHHHRTATIRLTKRVLRPDAPAHRIRQRVSTTKRPARHRQTMTKSSNGFCAAQIAVARPLIVAQTIHHLSCKPAVHHHRRR